MVGDLYRAHSQYWYSNGFNLKAVAALLIGILPNVPGFLTTLGWVASDAFPAFVNGLYHYAWFVGIFVGGAVYALLMSFFP